MSEETTVVGPPARGGQTSVLDEGIAMLQAFPLEGHERAVAGRRRHARRQPRPFWPDTLFGRPYWQVVRHLTLAAVTGTIIGSTLSVLGQPTAAPAAPPVTPSAQPEIPVTELAPTTQPSWTVEPTRFERRTTSTRPRVTRTSSERPIRTPVRTPVQTPARPKPTPTTTSSEAPTTPPETTSISTGTEVTGASQGVGNVDVRG